MNISICIRKVQSSKFSSTLEQSNIRIYFIRFVRVERSNILSTRNKCASKYRTDYWTASYWTVSITSDRFDCLFFIFFVSFSLAFREHQSIERSVNRFVLPFLFSFFHSNHLHRNENIAVRWSISEDLLSSVDTREWTFLVPRICTRPVFTAYLRERVRFQSTLCSLFDFTFLSCLGKRAKTHGYL